MGSARRSECWQLFLDESGDFDVPGEPVVVGGWLVRLQDSPRLVDAIKRQLCSAVPSAAYPQHASECRLPASRVVNLLRLRRARRQKPESWEAEVEPAIEKLLASAGHAAVAPILSAIEQDRKVRYDDLAACSDWLVTEHPDEAARLQRLVQNERRALFSFLGQVPKDDAFVVAAYDAADDGSPGDRYLRLLEGVFERILALFRSNDVIRTVRAHVLVRDVELPGLPEMALRSRDVADRVRAAERFPLLVPPPQCADDRVRIVPEVPSRWAETMHPGLVVADWLSNRLWGSLQNADTQSLRWDRVRSTIKKGVRLEPMARFCSSAEPIDLPTLAVQGDPRRAIVDAFAGAKQPLDATTCPTTWWREQSNLWIDRA